MRMLIALFSLFVLAGPVPSHSAVETIYGSIEDDAPKPRDLKADIIRSYKAALGREPDVNELKYWMSQPPTDSRLASVGNLVAAHINWLNLKGNQAVQEDVARRALKTALSNVSGIDKPGVVKNAVADLLARGKGGGYDGLVSHLQQPDVRKYYVDLARREPEPDMKRYRSVVTGAYDKWLGLSPHPWVLRSWMRSLAYGEKTEGEMHQYLQTYLKQKATDTTIKRSYQMVFSRDPSDGELVRWRQSVQSGEAWYESMVKVHRELAEKERAEECRGNSSVLYAYDGTETDETARSAIWHVATRFRGIKGCRDHAAFYTYGPSMMGETGSKSETGGGNIGCRDFECNFKRLFDFACKPENLAKYAKVFVIGFSRGGMNAIRFANDFPGCSGGRAVTFIGIVDPVDTQMGGNFNHHKALWEGRAGASLKLVKKNEWDSVLTTHSTPGFSNTIKIDLPEHPGETNRSEHWSMNSSTCKSGRWSESKLVEQMQSMGVNFSGVQESGGKEACWK